MNRLPGAYDAYSSDKRNGAGVHGRVRILKDVTISPRFRDEKLSIPLTFSYQACDDKVCYPPSQVKFALEVTLVPHDSERAPEALQKKKGSGR
jgi:hypothetical protein